MDSNKFSAFSAQIERFEVVQRGRRRRWTDDEKLKIMLASFDTASCLINGATIWNLTLAFSDLATIVWSVAEHH